MDGRLSGKVALITGAGSGQGAEAAALFANAGAKVGLLDVNYESAKQVADQIGPQASAYACDVADESSVRHAVEQVVATFGKLNIVYNNAGVILRKPGEWDESQDGPSADLVSDVFDRVLAVNLKGPYLVSKYALPHLIHAGGGSIINTSALAGAHHGTSNHAYSTAKAGVIGLTRAIANTYGEFGIRANALCPGLVETPLVGHVLNDPAKMVRYKEGSPLRRLGQADEIARVALFLASDDASFMTGSVVTADGGFMVA
jgi:NAD(P)-dependent dehydrogenase (short-subunit alcohol dehydrogenase family)